MYDEQFDTKPQETRTEQPSNGLSIAGLVLGILCCTAPIGLILSIISIKGGNKSGLSMVALTVSIIFTVLFLLLALSVACVFLEWGPFEGFWDSFYEEMYRQQQLLD